MASVSHVSVRGKFQEVFCLGIVADHFLGRLCLSDEPATPDLDMAALTSLFSSVSLSQGNSPAPEAAPLPPPPPGLLEGSPDPLANQLKAGLLVQMLKFVLCELNSKVTVDEDIVMQNVKHLLSDSPDFFFLLDKLFSCVHSQVSGLLAQFSLTKRFRLRLKIKATLDAAVRAGLLSATHGIFNLV